MAHRPFSPPPLKSSVPADIILARLNAEFEIAVDWIEGCRFGASEGGVAAEGLGRQCGKALPYRTAGAGGVERAAPLGSQTVLSSVGICADAT